MRSLVLSFLVAFLIAPIAALAKPPAKPLPVTTDQFHALRQLEAAPQHQAIRAVHATYTSDHDRHLDLIHASDDFWTIAYSGGFPATILGLIICAAPL